MIKIEFPILTDVLLFKFINMKGDRNSQERVGLMLKLVVLELIYTKSVFKRFFLSRDVEGFIEKGL